MGQQKLITGLGLAGLNPSQNRCLLDQGRRNYQSHESQHRIYIHASQLHNIMGTHLCCCSRCSWSGLIPVKATKHSSGQHQHQHLYHLSLSHSLSLSLAKVTRVKNFGGISQRSLNTMKDENEDSPVIDIETQGVHTIHDSFWRISTSNCN